jgi:hypothetical protein
MILDVALTSVGIHGRHVVTKPIDARISTKVARPQALAGAPKAEPLLRSERNEGGHEGANASCFDLNRDNHAPIESHDVELERPQAHVAAPNHKPPTLK